MDKKSTLDIDKLKTLNDIFKENQDLFQEDNDLCNSGSPLFGEFLLNSLEDPKFIEELKEVYKDDLKDMYEI